MRCLVCRGERNKVVFQEFGIDIYKCQQCGHMFSSYAANQYYKGYFGEDACGNDNFWWNEAHQKMYNDFCDKYIIGKNGRLIDIGCGLGYFVKKISYYPNWQVYGYEISQAAVDFARNELKLPNVFCGFVEEANFPEKSFDIVTLWDVIEHIPDPDKILNYVNSILKDDGFLFIHTPNANIQLLKARLKKLIYGVKSELHYLEAKDHINIYSGKSISIILRKNGFKIIKFIQLHPIQSMSGSKGRFKVFVKNLWFNFSKVCYWLSAGRINLNNLHIVAKKTDENRH